ncbi:pseudouridine synthase [Catenovulum sp. 2E275]|uniref:pseudouridine synthase n=1 Tax=Catenovulum sp. 2E275 TaxID=2980497 RepID=UPI0021D07C1D|nr:pseudouridine synthase [Catenovulum sp. 2E275]MCU4674368.1 pseudouridine synthase [Catenovulum sp. 2E275]
MRLDKYACEAIDLTRNEAKKAIKKGCFTVDGEVITNPAFKVTADANVEYLEEQVETVGQRYIMMHKPIDTICSTSDTEAYQSVISLMEIDKPERLHIAGRLDADTTGLVLITDDGKWSHRVTSPNYQCEKLYIVELAEPVLADEQLSMIEKVAVGIDLKSDDKPTLPAKLKFNSPQHCELTIAEGRYHQVKRMFAALGNKVVGLHRAKIGELGLDDELEPCEWRYLTDDEVALF